jgi:hypothetical protein
MSKLSFLKVSVFLKSLLFHIGAGFPRSTQKQIDLRYNICMGCDRFNKKDNECMECGCSINQKKIFMNKLAWADQECPLKKWMKLNAK